MRRVFAALVALVLALGVPMGALAAEGPPVQEPGEEPEEGADIIIHYFSRSYCKMLILYPGESATSLTLPEQTTFIAAPPGVPEEELYDHRVDLEVIWDIDGFDTTVPGLRYLTGTVVVPEGYVLAEDYDAAEVVWPVIVLHKEMEPIPIYDVSYYNGNFAAFPVGVDISSIPLRRGSFMCYLNEKTDDYFEVEGLWNRDMVDTSKPGAYWVEVTPDLPVGFSLPPDFKPQLDLVSITAETGVDLSAPVRYSVNIQCMWYEKIIPDSETVLQYAIGDGPWQNDSLTGWDSENSVSWEYGSLLDGNCLMIGFWMLEPDLEYYFRLVYGSGKISNALYVTIDGEGSINFHGGIGGDRDGSEDDGETMPPIEQPAPDDDDDDDTPSTPTPSPSPDNDDTPTPMPKPTPEPTPPPVTEIVTETSTTLSRARLAQLAQMGPTVLFSKQGVSAELPSDFLMGLALGATETLTVTLQAVGEDGFALAMTAGDKAVETLPETAVYRPLAAGAGDLICVDSGGAAVSPVVYDPARGTARCTIARTGSYRIQAAPVQAAELNAPEVVPPAGPRPATLTNETKLIAEQGAPGAATAETPAPTPGPAPAPTPVAAPTPVVTETPAVPPTSGPVETAPPGPVETPVAEPAPERPGGGFPVLPAALGGGALAAVGLWTFGRRRHG